MTNGIRHTTSFDVGPERKAPAEIQLWNVGPNKTDYGTHIWNERSVELAFGQYQERKNLLGIDIDHNKSTEALAEKKTDDPPRKAGYASLEIRDGAPWLVFQWSDYGRQQIESGERRYLSPEYYTDPDTQEIICIVRVSLVDEPGTWNARLLCSKGPQTPVGIIPADTSRLPVAARKTKTKAARMEDKDLALAGAVMLALQAIVDGASDDGLKQWAQSILDQMNEKLGDQAGPAMDMAKESAPASEPAPAPEAAEMAPEEQKEKTAKDDEEKKEMAKRLTSLESAFKTLTSKLETVLAKAGQAKPWVTASVKTRTPAPETTHGLSAEEYQRCQARKIDPAKYAASKAKLITR